MLVGAVVVVAGAFVVVVAWRLAARTVVEVLVLVVDDGSL